MPEALTSNSPGVTPGKGQYNNTNPGRVAFQLPQYHLWKPL